MSERHRLKSGMFLLTLFGALLMLPPLVLLFNQPIFYFGVPQIVFYLFGLWLMLIIGTALLTRAMPREKSEPGANEADT